MRLHIKLELERLHETNAILSLVMQALRGRPAIRGSSICCRCAGNDLGRLLRGLL
jgi:hypothetical protein